jgi:arsenite methyltransferase
MCAAANKENLMTPTAPTQPDEMKDQVRQRYGQIAATVLSGSNAAASCCGLTQPPDSATFDTLILLQATISCCGAAQELTTAKLLYDANELAGLPETVTGAALGCGNPTAIAALRPGQAVLDLGSGGGIDCFLAARQVGPSGQVIGLDMTLDMVALAERNKARLGEAAANVRFVRGEIEAIPLPDQEVDVIISNCVINLSADKDAVFREAFRVLRPGGYLAVSDTVALQPFSDEMKRDAATWSVCASGSLDLETYRAKLAAAGFAPVEISEVTPTDFGLSDGVDDGAATAASALAGGLKSWVASAQIRAYKPIAALPTSPGVC